MAVNGYIQCSLFRSDEPRPRLAGRIKRLSDAMSASGVVRRQLLLVPENEVAAAREFIVTHDLDHLEAVGGPHHPFSRFAAAVLRNECDTALRFSSASDPIPAPI